MKRVAILAVGSELLTPFFQDTNSLLLARGLNELGLEVSFKITVADRESDLVLMLQEASRLADIILVMGGLGPTADDLTREAASRAFSRKLLLQPEILERIENRFRGRGLPMPASNRKQAYVLEGAEVLKNDFGTAPGQWLASNGNVLVLLPGPPHELEPLFNREVLPRLEMFRRGYLSRRILKITGLTESGVEDLIAPLYPRDAALEISTLAKPGQIELHLKCFSSESREEAEQRLKPLEDSLRDTLGDHIFSTRGESLEETVGALLRLSTQTVACAESCTGGLISHRLTNVPGSSEYLLGAMVAYSNPAKETWLGVPRNILLDAGAVSAATAEAMAAGVRRAAFADFGLAATGIAGPGGGTPDKPVGLVYTAVAWDNGVESVKNHFLGNREQIKFQTSQKAMDMLRRRLLGTGK